MSEQSKRSARADERIAKVITKDWFRRVAPKVFPPVHRAMKRITRGRFVPGAGMVLTTIGAKTGTRRDIPLEAVPCADGSWVIVGSNFARDHHPAWTTNLTAKPDTQILVRGRTIDVHARLLDGAERAEAWDQALDHFSGWAAYEHITDRQFRIFRLTPSS